MEYYVHLNGEQRGPYTKYQIESLIANATIQRDTLIWCEDYTDWLKVSETEFAGAPPQSTNPAAPTPPPRISSTPQGYVPFDLFQGEQVLLKTLSNTTILTNYRIYNRELTMGGQYSNTLFLEDISSIEFGSKNKLLLLILAIIGFFVGISLAASGDEVGGIIGIGVGLLCFVFWWFSKQSALVITPNGGKHIRIDVKGSASEIDGVHKSLRKAKFERVQQLHASAR